MRKNKIGTCKLCGQTKELTFEHVPPEKAFNNITVKKIGREEVLKLIGGQDGRMPWDVEGIKGQYIQRGAGDFYLCKECNNNTGSWYMSDYINFVQLIHEAFCIGKFQEGGVYSFTLKGQYPLRIFKAIMTMFCDINYNCFNNEQLRGFLLNKESTELDLDKYKLYLYLVVPSLQRRTQVSAQLVIGKGKIICSEIACYPIGSMLCLSAPEWYQPGILINDYAKYKYDEIGDMPFYNIPCYAINTPYPGDFRSKKSIEETVNENKRNE